MAGRPGGRGTGRRRLADGHREGGLIRSLQRAFLAAGGEAAAQQEDQCQAQGRGHDSGLVRALESERIIAAESAQKPRGTGARPAPPDLKSCSAAPKKAARLSHTEQ